MKIAGAYVTRQQIWILAIVVCAMLGFHLLLQYTAIGKAMRATSTNVELAQASGVEHRTSHRLGLVSRYRLCWAWRRPGRLGYAARPRSRL